MTRTHANVASGHAGARLRMQSLRGYTCPQCREGLLHLRKNGTNVCDHCGYELITEWEWERRQRTEAKT